MAPLPGLVLPGQPLAPAPDYTPGPGTFIQSGTLYASIAGQPTITKPETSDNEAVNTALGKKNCLSVISSVLPSGNHGDNGTKVTLPFKALPDAEPPLPSVGKAVLARVTRLAVERATMEILAVGDVVAKQPYWIGQVRRVDVRATEKDRIKVAEAFRVGDLVRAKVTSLGDQSSYYLRTDENELGVVMAASAAGNQMYPISWMEFKDPKTGRAEVRKVAKPF